MLDIYFIKYIWFRLYCSNNISHDIVWDLLKLKLSSFVLFLFDLWGRGKSNEWHFKCKMTNVYVTLQQVFGIFSIILLVVGTIGNLFSCYVCQRIKNNSTFTFISFLTIADLLTLYYWNLNNFLSKFTTIDLLTTSLWVCKIGNFIQFSSLQCMFIYLF